MSFGHQLELTTGEGFREESLPGFFALVGVQWLLPARARYGNLTFPHPLPLPRDGVLCVWRSGSRGRGEKFCGGTRSGVGTLGAFPRFWQPALSGLFACEGLTR